MVYYSNSTKSFKLFVLMYKNKVPFKKMFCMPYRGNDEEAFYISLLNIFEYFLNKSSIPSGGCGDAG